MASDFWNLLREHAAMFFTNWRNPNYTVPQKIRLTVKNRAIGLVNGGCCGNHGQPGC
jgi:hypothetical protein